MTDKAEGSFATRLLALRTELSADERELLDRLVLAAASPAELASRDTSEVTPYAKAPAPPGPVPMPYPNTVVAAYEAAATTVASLPRPRWE